MNPEKRRSRPVRFRTTDAILEHLKRKAKSNKETVSNEIHALCEKEKRKADRYQ